MMHCWRLHSSEGALVLLPRRFTGVFASSSSTSSASASTA
eukprot:CAMPEP_0181053288 /NCGR_PEP_ID=MMETSP1070-20121207/18030_1 /TAXON_ID=265543 /ORGANISM="Minutocellus polymorphus, Strain NH13" /LENGTH=39 /DNA_ID= /DNA_START= /DNA_END= /DNA_ORIENTATION=